jgi:hypothetical protein
MAGRRRQDLLGKLADPFEDTLQKLGSFPGAQHFVRGLMGLRDRVDELAKRMARIDELEKRVRDLERRVNQMSGSRGGRGTTRRSSGTAAKRSTTSKTTARRTTRSSSSRPRRRSS